MQLISNFKQLEQKFLNVKNMGWIQSKYGGFGSIGRTFEDLIGLSRNEFEIPDFNGIEIKTKRETSNSYISLFNAAMDGKKLFETRNFVNRFGWPNRNYPSTKVLYGNIFGNKMTYIGVKHIMKLDVNYSDKCVYLNVYSKFGYCLSYKEYCWSFDLLEEKLTRKLTFLALVIARNRYIGDKEFFYYKEIMFYRLISFEKFCELIETGIIRVSFKVGVCNSGKNAGKTYDHGTCFSIRECDLEKLFTKF